MIIATDGGAGSVATNKNLSEVRKKNEDALKILELLFSLTIGWRTVCST